MIPTGVGIGLRKGFASPLLEGSFELDFLEITPENHVGRGGRDHRDLRACAERWPMLAHGVSVSLGGPDPFDLAWLRALKELLDLCRIPLYTDHLCFTSLGGLQTHELLPLPETEEAVRHVAARIRVVRDVLDRPVAIENISQYAVMPGATLGREAFVRAVCEEADCGLLLDVNNVVVNARNHRTDARRDLLALPLERTAQIHVAGHEIRHGLALDTHGAPVSAEVLALTREALTLIGRPVPVLLERDLNLPPVAEVVAEAATVRATLAPALRGAA